MNKNQKLTITLIASIAALVGVLVGILAYFRKKAAELDDDIWDYSGTFDKLDDDFDSECDCGYCGSSDEDFEDHILFGEDDDIDD